MNVLSYRLYVLSEDNLEVNHSLFFSLIFGDGSGGLDDIIPPKLSPKRAIQGLK